MPTALRPMTGGELLDRTVNLYRRNFTLFFGISVLSAAFQLFIDLGQLAVSRSGLASGAALDALSTFFFIALGLIVFAITEGATVFAVSAVHLSRSISISECYSRLRGRYLRVSALALVQFVILLGLLVLMGIAVIIPTAIISVFLGSLLTWEVLGWGVLFVAVVLSLYVFARYAVATAACVLEDLDIGDALRRSARLTEHDRRRVFIISSLYLVLFYGTMWAMLGPFTLLAGEIW